MKIEAKPGKWKALQHKEDPDSLILMSEDEWVLPRLKEINPAVGEIDVNDERMYPYHATVSKQAFAQILFSLAVDLDYEEHNAMMDEHTPESDDPEDDDADLEAQNEDTEVAQDGDPDAPPAAETPPEDEPEE
jgi:hypothetical protein